MANIGLDATCLSLYGKGVSSYQYNLIKGLSKFDKENSYYIFLNTRNPLPSLPIQENFHYLRAYKPTQVFWDQFQLPLFIRKYKIDIFHSSTDTLPMMSKAKLLLCVNEIPDYRIKLSKSNPISLYTRLSQEYNRIFFRESLRKASIIIAISNSTKSDLINKYCVDKKRVRVVYLAADECFKAGYSENDISRTRAKYNANSGYILHFSSTDPRDNTFIVIRAYHKALSVLKEKKKLIIVGSVDARKTGLEKAIKELRLQENIIFTGHLLRKEDLVALYQGADAYVDPSLYEGFGLQVVEAMACGTPVITSNITSLPEIAGDAAILVSPSAPDDLASAIVNVLTDSKLSESMRRKSLERAKFFSWDNTAQKTLDIYTNTICM